MKIVAIDALVAAAVLIILVSILGMLRMRDAYQRMHYISPAASLTPILITIAIFLDRGAKPEAFKALFTTLILIAMNTLVTHAAARAFRIAEVRNWDPEIDDEVPIKADDEPIGQENNS